MGVHGWDSRVVRSEDAHYSKIGSVDASSGEYMYQLCCTVSGFDPLCHLLESLKAV